MALRFATRLVQNYLRPIASHGWNVPTCAPVVRIAKHRWIGTSTVCKNNSEEEETEVEEGEGAEFEDDPSESPSSHPPRPMDITNQFQVAAETIFQHIQGPELMDMEKKMKVDLGSVSLEEMPEEELNELPVFPVLEVPLFPGLLGILKGQEAVVADNFRSPKDSNKPFYVGISFAKKDFRNQFHPQLANKKAMELEDMHSVGVVAKVIHIQPHHERSAGGLMEGMRIPPRNYVTVFLEAISKIRLTAKVRNHEENLAKKVGGFVAKAEILQDDPYDAHSTNVQEHVHEIVDLHRQLIQKGSVTREFSAFAIQQTRFPDKLADFTIAGASIHPEKMQTMLETLDVLQRLEFAQEALVKAIAAIDVGQEITKAVDKKIAETHRQFLMKETLKIAKQELGIDRDEKEAIVKKFKDRMEAMTIPNHVQTVLDDELNKLSFTDPSSAEFNVTRNYVDWLTLLPWGIYGKEVYDLAGAQEILDADHFGLKDIKERVLEFMAVSSLHGTGKRGKILCLVGPPGTGKTSVASSIARALGREFFRFSVGGMGDVAEIKGHRRTYVGAMPGKMVQALKACKVSNPVILIDEIDKVGRHSIQGDPSSALLEVLDPEQNGKFMDHFLDVPLDLSRVMFLCTANSSDLIPGPLLDRMEVMRLSGYVMEEKMHILKRYLIPQCRKDTGLTSVCYQDQKRKLGNKQTQISITDGAAKTLIRSYCREAGVRNLQKKVDKIFRKAALKIVQGEFEKTRVTVNALNEYLGPPQYLSDRIYDRTPAGVATGLAWTSMGGSILFIETVREEIKEGKGGLVMTGRMGEVMKESAEIAYSYAKRILKKWMPNNTFLHESLVRMHIPEGAIPKDGPSAGITMVTALLSLATGEPIAHNVAMSGETCLTGLVLPVGGVKEKLVGAKRSGIKKVVLPEECRKMVAEIDDYIMDGIHIEFCQTYEEVVKHVLPKLGEKIE